MSDSGRTSGNCPHARAPEWCVECLRADNDRLRRALDATEYAIQQSLGTALGYPRYCDDLVNFPDATPADGVCVGDHVAETLAAEAAREIERMRWSNTNAIWRPTTMSGENSDKSASHYTTPPFQGWLVIRCARGCGRIAVAYPPGQHHLHGTDSAFRLSDTSGDLSLCLTCRRNPQAS